MTPLYKFLKTQLTESFLVVTLIALAIGGLSACGRSGVQGNSLEWKEDVRLPDGRTVVVSRKEEFKGAYEPGSSPNTSRTSFEFTNPDNGSLVSFTAQGAYRTISLFSDGKTFYLILGVFLGQVVEIEGCPQPRRIFLKHNGSTWQRLPFDKPNIEEMSQNMTKDPNGSREAMKESKYHLDRRTVEKNNISSEGRKTEKLADLMRPTLECPNSRKSDQIVYP